MPYLGVMIDERLKWDVHTEVQVTKAKKAIRHLKRVGDKHIPKRLLKPLITGKVLPIFMYCQSACYPVYQKDRTLLERLNRYICKIITNDFQSPYLDLLDRLNMQPIAQTVLHQRVLLAKKYNHKSRYMPPGRINRVINGRLRNRGHSQSLSVRPSTDFDTQNSALETLIADWNALPEQAVALSYQRLKNHLQATSYNSNTEPYMSSMRVVRAL